MWYLWTAILVSCALVAAETGVEAPAASAPAPATTRAPPRTLDRQAYELAWRTWLQSPESGNPNAPPRRITTKSLFITPLVCPKGQRLDRNGCVQVVTVNKDEHERILLEQLNALFTSAPSGDVVYDYGDEEPGPLQLSIPIGLDPQASPLQAQEPTAQAQESQANYVKVDKKDEKKPDTDVGLEAELELLQLQHALASSNDTGSVEVAGILNHNVLQSLLDKPKRDSPIVNSTETDSEPTSDEGQKELVYGHVNIDPILVQQEIQDMTKHQTETVENGKPIDSSPVQNNATHINTTIDKNNNIDQAVNVTDNNNNYFKNNATEIVVNTTTLVLKKDGDKTKLNPENDYADIGEAIKLISRYAEVTTDDNFTKDQNNYANKDDSILGTRTKLQYRRNKPKKPEIVNSASVQLTNGNKEKIPTHAIVHKKDEIYYRYPWQGQHSPTPPPDYPFRHIQDYWPDRNQVGGVYNMAHENPRRHHHTYPHNYFRPHGFPYVNYQASYPGMQEAYPGQGQFAHNRVAPHHTLVQAHDNQDLYTLLGLRHWFSSEGTSKR